MPADSPATLSAPLGQFEYELTDELAYRSTAALFDVGKRKILASFPEHGWGHPILPIVIGIVSIFVTQVIAFLVAWDAWQVQALAVIGLVVQLLLVFKALLYFSISFADWYLRWISRRGLRHLTHRTIRWTFFEDRLETSSAASQRKLSWKDLTKIETFPEFWFLTFQGVPPLLVPVSTLAADLQELIRRKAAETGATLASPSS